MFEMRFTVLKMVKGGKGDSSRGTGIKVSG
jgi:hypothetical protein